jgi:pimeloyl-ACP methyl ester carboxylesterase
MGLEHRLVRSNGIRLHCVVEGDGPLVILLHGFPEYWYSWRHQIPALAERFRVVAPDLRGYNESEKPAGVAAYAMHELVADVEGLVRAFGERDAAIVGHDWGGAIAWTFAMERPALTRRLAVLNCPHPAIFQQELRRNPRQLARSWYMFFFQVPWLPEFLLGLGHARAVGRAVQRSAVRREAITGEDVQRLRDAAMHSGALRGALNYYRAAFRDPAAAALLPAPLRRFLFGDQPLPPARRTLADWPRIAAPTLVIWGEQDVALEKTLTAGMEPLFTGPFEVRYVPDSGHWVQQEHPELVNRWLLEFLSGNGHAPA